jgi:hypothetical protein
VLTSPKGNSFHKDSPAFRRVGLTNYKLVIRRGRG